MTLTDGDGKVKLTSIFGISGGAATGIYEIIGTDSGDDLTTTSLISGVITGLSSGITIARTSPTRLFLMALK
ncbi:MAG: hypothetical protein LBD13_00540 [Spirochaetaceae bacterium]|nr:hypothetical protein [Spirochaetaceae bacterium]